MAEKDATTKTSKTAQAETEYTMEDFYENPSVLDATQDLVMAAFSYNKIKKSTVKEAKRIVKEFKERKVTC